MHAIGNAQLLTSKPVLEFYTFPHSQSSPPNTSFSEKAGVREKCCMRARLPYAHYKLLHTS